MFGHHAPRQGIGKHTRNASTYRLVVFLVVHVPRCNGFCFPLLPGLVEVGLSLLNHVLNEETHCFLRDVVTSAD